jgi:hypothetical protein
VMNSSPIFDPGICSSDDVTRPGLGRDDRATGIAEGMLSVRGPLQRYHGAPVAAIRDIRPRGPR